jgi:hypothetical protein
VAESFTHGRWAYGNRGCRCSVCTEDWRLYRLEWRRRRGITPRVIKGRTHGKRSTYTHGCRCEECREAEAMYRRELRHATGETREGRPEHRKYA